MAQTTEAEIINPNAVELLDNGKTFDLATQCKDPEQLYLDKRNFVPMLDKLKKIARGLVADVHTNEGIDARKALNRKLASLKKFLDDEGKKVSDALKKKPNIILDTRKNLRDTIEMLQEEVMAPIKKIEERKKEIEEIRCIPGSALGCPIDGIKQYISMLEEHVHDEQYWDESYAVAFDAINESRRQLNDMLASAEKAEKERQELEALRAKQAEFERIEKEKAQAALREAEEAKRKAEEAERAKAKAEADAKAAEEAEARAKAEAERAKQQAEAAKANATVTVQGNAQKAIKDAEKTKSEMLFPEDQQTYKRTCNREALDDIKSCGIDEEKAKAIITAIVKGKVRHIVMMY